MQAFPKIEVNLYLYLRLEIRVLSRVIAIVVISAKGVCKIDIDLSDKLTRNNENNERL